MKHLALIGALFIAAVSPARAETCAHRPLILQTAQAVLDARTDLGRFEQRRFGAEAVYLLIRYGAFSDAEIEAMLGDLATARVHGAADLHLAWRVARFGAGELLAQAGTSFRNWSNPHVLHALIGLDAGQTVLRLFAQARADPDAATTLLAMSPINGPGIAAITADFDDAARLRFARHAEAAGELRLAAHLLADRADLAEFRDLLARHAGAGWVEEILFGPGMWQWGTGLRVQEAPLRVDGLVETPEVAARRLSLYRVSKASYHDGLFAWLSIYVSQTGHEAESLAAADAFLNAHATGQVDPLRDPEAGWLIMFETLADAVGVEALRTTLQSFDMPSRSLRHFAGSAATTFDWVIAKRALRPLLTGKIETPPPRPSLLSPGWNWTEWTAIARALREDPTAPLPPSQHAIAAELLADAGAWEAAFAFAAQLEPRERVRLHSDFMKRLDRLCDAVSHMPGQALLLGGMTLYHFPSAQ
ncbi:MAG: hypothetical protein AAGE13_06860 [Pseudomonadota bacterium]